MWFLFIYVTLVYSEATIIIVPLNSKSKKVRLKMKRFMYLLDGSFIATCLDIDILAICLINEWFTL